MKKVTLISIFLPFILSAPILNNNNVKNNNDIINSSKFIPRTISIPISMRENLIGQVTPEERLAMMERVYYATLKKYPSTLNDSNILTKRSTEAKGFVQIGDMSGDNTYYASIQIGTPPVTFEVALDTGSADLILVTAPCTAGCNSDTPLYIQADSTTAIKSTRAYAINYQLGGAIGTVATDFMSFGGYSNPSQVFGAVTSSTETVGIGGISGVLGLAFQTLSTISAMPFVEYLWKSGLLPEPVFGFSPARWGSSQIGSVLPGGFMTLGGVNKTLFQGEIQYIDVTSTYFWMIPLLNIQINGVPLDVNTRQVNIDTGTTNIYVPRTVADRIYNSIPGSNAVANGIYTFPCNSIPTLAFNFGSIYYTMNPNDFNIGPADNIGKNCYGVVGAIGPLSSGADQYIIGDAFLKNVYTAFKFGILPSVGFALLSNPQLLKTGYVPKGNGITVAEGGNLLASTKSSNGVEASGKVSNGVGGIVITSTNIGYNSVVAANSQVGSNPSSSSSNSSLSGNRINSNSTLTPININVNTYNTSVITLASKIQEALMSTLSTLVKNSFTLLSCPFSLNKSNSIWTCSSNDN